MNRKFKFTFYPQLLARANFIRWEWIGLWCALKEITIQPCSLKKLISKVDLGWWSGYFSEKPNAENKRNKMKKIIVTVLAIVAAGWLCNAMAGSIGDKAAPLVISEWIKGEPVNVTDGKNVYVVEFWATWCPPCRASIPHLTELQKRFKSRGVVIVGVSNETAEKVKPFVKSMGDKMDYRVALDRNRQTSAAYMTAFNQNGIPHAFIVDRDGRIAWHGHPMAGLDKAIEKILEGKKP